MTGFKLIKGIIHGGFQGIAVPDSLKFNHELYFIGSYFQIRETFGIGIFPGFYNPVPGQKNVDKVPNGVFIIEGFGIGRDTFTEHGVEKPENPVNIPGIHHVWNAFQFALGYKRRAEVINVQHQFEK